MNHIVRSPSEVRQLEEKLLTLLAAAPGLTRADLASSLGLAIEEIERPMINLVQGGKIKRSGHRYRCRYWPNEKASPP